MKNQIKILNYSLALLFFFIVNGNAAHSQDSKDKKKDDNVIRMEAVKEKCKDLAYEKRIRLTVARFTSTAGNSPKELGENMSTMLSSALTQVNCFNVLEEQKNMNDLKGEIDISNSEYTNAATGIEKGQMKIAQIIVTGEITEFNESNQSQGTLGISSNSSKSKIGFILKVINPRTREILKATSFNVESKKGSGGSFKFVGIKMSSKTASNPATADALEKGIIQAVEYLAAEKENIPLPSAEELNSNLTMVTVSNVSFSQKSNTLDMLRNTAGVKSAELSKYANNVAIYAVKHNGSTDDLATVIDKKYAGRFEITGAESGKINMNLK